MIGLFLHVDFFSFIGNIGHFAYGAIALLLAGGIIGLPVPDELLLVFTGYLIYLGNLHFLPTIIWSFIGSLAGMTGSYLLGRYVGIPAIDKYGKKFGLNQQKLLIVQQWFNRFGRYTITFGYFIPGIRQFTAFFSAVSRMSYWEFALYAIPGGIIWVVLFINIGWHLGRGWHKAARFFHTYHYIVLALVIILALFLFKKFKIAEHFIKPEDKNNDTSDPPC